MEVDDFADDLNVSVREQEFRVADVWCGYIAVVGEGTVGNIAGLKQRHMAVIVSGVIAVPDGTDPSSFAAEVNSVRSSATKWSVLTFSQHQRG